MNGKCIIFQILSYSSDVYCRGAGLASRLATYLPDRIYGMVMLSVGYIEPGLVWDVGA
jgi:hypothetical protein